MNNEVLLPIIVKISKGGNNYRVYLPKKLNELWKQLEGKEVVFYLKLSCLKENG